MNSGLVVTFITEVETVVCETFDGEPLEAFTLTEMVWDGSDARFGCEQPWVEAIGNDPQHPRGCGTCARCQKSGVGQEG